MRWNGKNFRPRGIGRQPINPQPVNVGRGLNTSKAKWVATYWAGPIGTPAPPVSPSPTPSNTPTPSITPTSSPTPTPSATITPTATPTPTPTPTPSSISLYADISPTGYYQYENVILTGSTNISSPTYVWSLSNFNDVSGNTITSYTGNPLTEGYFTTTGSSNVSLVVSGTEGSATASTFSVSASTFMLISTAINSNVAQISYDGTNWSNQTIPGSSTDDWINLAQHNGLAVLINREITTATKFAQTDDGLNYTTSNWSGGYNFRPNALVYSEFLDAFVAPAKDNTEGSFMVQSSDGFSWSQMAIPTNDSCSIISDETNNLLLYTDETTLGIYSSPDGVNWTLRQTLNSRAFQAIHNKTFGTSVFIGDFSDIVWYSTDGINWTNRGALGSLGNTQIQSITYRRSDGRMLACSYQTSIGYYSDDGGYIWDTFTMPASDVIGMGHSKVLDKFFVVTRTGLIYNSTDGISSWTQQTNSATGDYRYIGEFIFRN